MWANTYMVGCGYTYYNDDKRGYSKLYVCNYGPGGNLVGGSLVSLITSDDSSQCESVIVVPHGFPRYVWLSSGGTQAELQVPRTVPAGAALP